MTDDLLLHPSLRRMVAAVGPVTFDAAALFQLRTVFRWCDGLRIRNTRLEERLKVQESRIDQLRRIVGLHRTEVTQLQTLAAGALAERDVAVLERDQAKAELLATEEQVVALRAELDRLRAGVPA